MAWHPYFPVAISLGQLSLYFLGFFEDPPVRRGSLPLARRRKACLLLIIRSPIQDGVDLKPWIPFR